jgi:hypothetical protein
MADKIAFQRPDGGYSIAGTVLGMPVRFWCRHPHPTEDDAARCPSANAASMRAAGVYITDEEMAAILEKRARPGLAAEIAERGEE